MVDVDALELEVEGVDIAAGGVDAVLVADHLPNFGADLVTARIVTRPSYGDGPAVGDSRLPRGSPVAAAVRPRRRARLPQRTEQGIESNCCRFGYVRCLDREEVGWIG